MALTVAAQPVLVLGLITALGYQKVEFPSTRGLSFLPPADLMYVLLRREGGVCVWKAASNANADALQNSTTDFYLVSQF